ncbi:MAG: hypothetical protein ACXWWD_07750 [Chitinophagaceae bacterium]
MKKFVFAVQVFGIIALFPIYVILEMNHGIERLPENRNYRGAKEIIEAPAVHMSSNAEAQKEISIPVKILLGSTVLPGRNEIIRALAGEAPKAY